VPLGRRVDGKVQEVIAGRKAQLQRAAAKAEQNATAMMSKRARDRTNHEKPRAPVLARRLSRHSMADQSSEAKTAPEIGPISGPEVVTDVLSSGSYTRRRGFKPRRRLGSG
jgi:spore germination cell wall hydrolase CwlJ-like protein